MRWSRKLAAVLPGLICVALAAQTDSPVLHQRSDSHGTVAPTNAAGIEKGFSTLPADASGEYELDDDGSVVQITLEDGRLTGYVTRMEHETALTLFFERSTTQGDRISFSTSTVHGLSYSFAGLLARGETQEKSQPGAYRMVGEWTVHRGANVEAMRVNLKSTPRLDGE